MGRFRQLGHIETIATVITAVAAFSWGTAVAGLWGPFPHRGADVNLAVAATTAVIAAMCWLTRYRARLDQSRDLLIEALADVAPPRPRAKTLPMPRVVPGVSR